LAQSDLPNGTASLKTNLYLRILVGTAVVGLTLAYTIARLLGKGHPLEPVNLGLIAIAAACLLFLIYPAVLGRLHSIEGAGIKIELLEERQKQQQLQLDEFALILPILLPAFERKHLLNLASGDTKGYVGNDTLRLELRRLRSVGLIRNTKPIGYISDGREVDLADFVQLTDLGRRWVPRLLDYEREIASESDQGHR
jgi:hypothetical protein